MRQGEARATELPGRSRVQFDRLLTSPNYSDYMFAAAPELGFHSRDNEKPLQMIVSGHANRFEVFIGIGRLKLVPGAVRWLAAGPCAGRERFWFT